VQPHLANLGTGRATLRFGRLWTGAMVAQVALTAMGIPVAMESASQTMRKVRIRAQFPSGEYMAARIDLDRPFDDETNAAAEQRRANTFAALARRVGQEPGVVAVAFSDRVPGVGGTRRFATVDAAPGATPAYDGDVLTSAVTPEFFETLSRPITAGRAFHAGDSAPTARTVVVNEAFARALARDARQGSPIGARLRYPAASAREGDASTEAPFEIVGVLRDVGLDPDDQGNEQPSVFHAASIGSMTPLLMTVRLHGSPAALAARLPVLATTVDARLLVPQAQPLQDWIRDTFLMVSLGVELAVTVLVLFLSALGIFSLASVSVSRRTREIGLRVSLGATPRHVLAGILAQVVLLMASGLGTGCALVLAALAFGLGPSGLPADDIALFSRYLAMTSVVMLISCLLACIGPASRALRLNPGDALRDA
jgi:hypothetical protein